MKGGVKILIITLIILEIFLYEWGIFEIGVIAPIAYALKTCIPFFLGGIALLNIDARLPKYFVGYLSLFLLFSAVTLVACLLSSQFNESITQFIKIIPPRLFFIFSLCVLLYNYPDLILALNKVLFVIAVFTFFQHILAVLYVQSHPFEETSLISESRGINFAGPMGLFGNINTQSAIFDVQYLRLTGFWLEPSNASGYMMSCFFLAKFVKAKEGTGIFKGIFYVLPLIGCMLCLSNVGYLTLAVSLCTFVLLSNRNPAVGFVKILPFILILLSGLMGRELVYTFFPDNDYLKLVVGLRSTDASSEVDFSDGRIGNYKTNFTKAVREPFGIGLRIPGENNSGGGDNTASASAFFYLLVTTGFLGLVIILCLKFIVIGTVISRRAYINLKKRRLLIFMFSAWLCVTVQNLVYGTWMSPYYYYLAIASIVLFSHIRNEKNEFV